MLFRPPSQARLSLAAGSAEWLEAAPLYSMLRRGSDTVLLFTSRSYLVRNTIRAFVRS